MTLKKMLLSLAAMALAAAVVASPAAANEKYHFLKEGQAIGSPAPTVHFTGPASFENESGGIACSETTANVEFTTFQAHIEQFKPLNCETTGLLKAFGCELTAVNAPQSTNLPWTVTPVSLSQATASGIVIDNPMQAGCLFGSNIVAESEGENTVTLNVTGGEIGTVTLSGGLETTVGPVTVEGELTPTEGEPVIEVSET